MRQSFQCRFLLEQGQIYPWKSHWEPSKLSENMKNYQRNALFLDSRGFLKTHFENPGQQVTRKNKILKIRSFGCGNIFGLLAVIFRWQF